MTTGWGTMFPTFSTPSRNLCIVVLGSVVCGGHLGLPSSWVGRTGFDDRMALGQMLGSKRFELTVLRQRVMSAESKALAASPEIDHGVS